VIEEVLRHDPPVQNTRRFVAQAGTVAGREMREGDAVLVVLAAANRDPAAPLFSFGAGRHACPGQSLAATIARAGVEQALAAGVDPAPLAEGVSYRPSVNVRIPLFRVEEVRRVP
jgi:cytochrome P450